MSDAAAVSLVIPGRNCEATVRACLDAVVPLLRDPGSPLASITFVDDGSTDGTAAIVDGFPVERIAGPGRGPGAARNLGWRAAPHDRVWFIDADCVAEPAALDRLVPHLDDAAVAAVSGTYGIMNPESLLARLVHEEIVERHGRMGTRVNWMATFNVLYRRDVLAEVGGFDERYLKAQDAELAFRVLRAGRALAFERASRVRHFHPARIGRYLRTQSQQGYWRVWLHTEHHGYAMENSYSGFVDHVQPPIAMALLASVPALAAPTPLIRGIPAALALALALAQAPMTWRLLRRTHRWEMLAFAPMSFVRAFARGVGMTRGALSVLGARLSGRPERRAGAE